MKSVKSCVLVCALAASPGAGRLFGEPQAAEAPRAPSPMTFSFVQAGGSYLGVFVAEIDADRARTLKLPEERGVEITRVESDSPAEKAGLKVGDVVLAYEGEHIQGMEQFRRLIRETPAGRHVTLAVFRNGAMQNVSAVIGTAKAHGLNLVAPETLFGHELQMNSPESLSSGVMVPDLPQILPGAKSPMLGVETEALSTQLAHFFGVNHGVLIRSVLSGSAAEKAGLRAGDIIVKADDTEISSPGKLSFAVRNASVYRHPLALLVIRNRESMNFSISLGQENGWAPRGAQAEKQPAH